MVIFHRVIKSQENLMTDPTNTTNDVVQASVDQAASVAKRRPGAPVNPNSKLSQSRAIIAELAGQGLAAKDIKGALVTRLGLSKQTANTYYHMINRK